MKLFLYIINYVKSIIRHDLYKYLFVSYDYQKMLRLCTYLVCIEIFSSNRHHRNEILSVQVFFTAQTLFARR